jgi:hypothetical protein
MISLSTKLGQKLRSLQLQSLGKAAGECVAVFLMRLLQSCQLFLYLGQALSVRRLRIRCGKRRVRLALLPAGFLSRFALCCARVIGDGAADDFLESRLKWICFTSHRFC